MFPRKNYYECTGVHSIGDALGHNVLDAVHLQLTCRTARGAPTESTGLAPHGLYIIFRPIIHSRQYDLNLVIPASAHPGGLLRG